jgi:hypothetical protein
LYRVAPQTSRYQEMDVFNCFNYGPFVCTISTVFVTVYRPAISSSTNPLHKFVIKCNLAESGKMPDMLAMFTYTGSCD